MEFQIHGIECIAAYNNLHVHEEIVAMQVFFPKLLPILYRTKSRLPITYFPFIHFQRKPFTIFYNIWKRLDDCNGPRQQCKLG